MVEKMSRLSLLACLVALAGCPGHKDVPCTDDVDCDLTTGGRCTSASSGNKWCAYPDSECSGGLRYSDENVGDDLAGVCIEGTQHKLSITIGGNGAGAVETMPTGLTCSTGTCVGMFPEGTILQLKATPTSGAFLGWGDECQGMGNCAVTLDRDRSVGALFGVAGEALWVKQLGSSGVDTGLGIAVDNQDNVIAVGQFNGTVTLGTTTLTSAGGKDIFVAKFAAATGALVWAKRYGGTLDDWGQAVTTDSARNIYITGLMRDVVDFGGGPLTASGSDAYVVKLAADGTLGWARKFGGTGYEQGFSIVANDTTAIVVGSHTNTMIVDGITVAAGGTPNSFNAFAAALGASNGTAVWAKSFGGTGTDFGYGVTMDSAGNVVLTGSFENAADFGGGVLTAAGGTSDTDIFLVKLAGATGAHLFSKRVGSTGFEEATAISTDAANNIVVIGNFRAAIDFGCGSAVTPTNTEEMFLVKYSQAGACTWVKNFNAHGSDVMVNAAGDVSFTGYFAGSISFGGPTLSAAGANDVFAARFNPAGGHLNSVRAGGTGDEKGNAVAQSANGRFFVTGGFTGFAEFGGMALTSAGADDAFVLGLAPL